MDKLGYDPSRLFSAESLFVLLIVGILAITCTMVSVAICLAKRRWKKKRAQQSRKPLLIFNDDFDLPKVEEIAPRFQQPSHLTNHKQVAKKAAETMYFTSVDNIYGDKLTQTLPQPRLSVISTSSQNLYPTNDNGTLRTFKPQIFS